MWPFKKKTLKEEKKALNDNEKITEKVSKVIKIQETPKICCIDIDSQYISRLQETGLNIYSGSLGKKIRVPNLKQYDNHRVLLNYDFPENIHEFDIFILDLDNSKSIEYVPKDHIREDHTGKYSYSLLSSYPETVFDPRPYSSKILNGLLNQIGNRKHMIICFTTGSYTVDYEPIKFSENGYNREEIINYGIYSFLDYVPLFKNKLGKEIYVTKENIKQDIKNFLSMVVGKTTYHQTFHHPKKWDSNSHSNIDDPSFFPLIYNSSDEIISYYNSNDKSNIFFFPQMENKFDFIKTFLQNIGPEISPELFPHNTEFNWKTNEDYWLPNHKQLLEKKDIIAKKYEKKLSKLERDISENITNYSFLHDILTETGDNLVNVLIQYLKWLGFTNCINADSLKTDDLVLEEDIQVQLDNGSLLIIESKGIGGTSTDSECSQISKIKHRRCKERNNFDVIALYIVNHQRYLPPKKRKNPPFTDHQIQDAINDERGLLSTWQLFNLYYDVENEILTKKEAREKILDFGLVSFTPSNLELIYEPDEILKDGYVCIVIISDLKLNKGEYIYIEAKGRYSKLKIKEIRINDKSVNECSNGEVGLLLDKPLKRKSKLYKKAVTV